MKGAAAKSVELIWRQMRLRRRHVAAVCLSAGGDGTAKRCAAVSSPYSLRCFTPLVLLQAPGGGIRPLCSSAIMKVNRGCAEVFPTACVPLRRKPVSSPGGFWGFSSVPCCQRTDPHGQVFQSPSCPMSLTMTRPLQISDTL